MILFSNGTVKHRISEAEFFGNKIEDVLIYQIVSTIIRPSHVPYA